MTQKFVSLTKENIKVGAILRNKNNPSWGAFRVTRHYDESIWEIGEIVLFESEFKFWEVRIN